VADPVYPKSRRRPMIVIAAVQVTDAQRKQIAQALGKSAPADRNTVRAYVQAQCNAALARLGHPLISAEAH
jgi:hypothetical protein